MIVDIGIGNNLQVCIGVSIKQVPLSLGLAFYSNNIKTIFFEKRVVLMHNETVGVVGLDFKGFVFDFGLWF